MQHGHEVVEDSAEPRLFAGLALVEFIEDHDGRRYTYDINGTTNYSGVLGARIGIDGMRAFASYLRREVVPSLALELVA